MIGMVKSDISGLYKLSTEERREIIAKEVGLEPDEVEILKKFGGLDEEVADRMIENVIGSFPLPLGIATNFVINGKEYLIPMAIEEPSVVAAASNGAKLARSGGGFRAECSSSVMVGQIQIVKLDDAKRAIEAVRKNSGKILELARKNDGMTKYGGGVRELRYRLIETRRGDMLIIELLVDVCDAMGANSVNSLLESISPEIEKITGGKVRLRILSNLAVYRTAKARAVWKREEIGEDAIEGILDAYEFAANDVYRCATHNKGIMNGIDAVVIATGNDFRAIEAGAHSFASLSGGYRPLTRYWKNSEGDLEGEIEIPVAVGTVGGATKVHPVARVALKILGVKSAKELGCVLAAVGLAQNFAALRALSTEGIQRGHMRLAARNIAATAGASGELVDRIAEEMIREKKISVEMAKKLIERFNDKR
ncbi:MAG: hydroxymethylglutaryl-CoA reductase, degradative [Candidatus Anstonellales archaeon]